MIFFYILDIYIFVWMIYLLKSLLIGMSEGRIFVGASSDVNDLAEGLGLRSIGIAGRLLAFRLILSLNRYRLDLTAAVIYSSLC